VKVKKADARRRIEPKPKEAVEDALVEQHETSQVPAQYDQGSPFPPTPTTLGGAMKEVRLPCSAIANGSNSKLQPLC
jgi:hypothetical protein